MISNFNSCIIHNNDEKDNEIFITNKKTGTIEGHNFNPIGDPSTIKSTITELIHIHKGIKDQKSIEKITIRSIPEKGCDDEITILTNDLRSFMRKRAFGKISDKLIDLECSADDNSEIVRAVVQEFEKILETDYIKSLIETGALDRILNRIQEEILDLEIAVDNMNSPEIDEVIQKFEEILKIKDD
jgi:hypothetical protein